MAHTIRKQTPDGEVLVTQAWLDHPVEVTFHLFDDLVMPRYDGVVRSIGSFVNAEAGTIRVCAHVGLLDSAMSTHPRSYYWVEIDDLHSTCFGWDAITKASHHFEAVPA